MGSLRLGPCPCSAPAPFRWCWLAAQQGVGGQGLWASPRRAWALGGGLPPPCRPCPSLSSSPPLHPQQLLGAEGGTPVGGAAGWQQGGRPHENGAPSLLPSLTRRRTTCPQLHALGRWTVAAPFDAALAPLPPDLRAASPPALPSAGRPGRTRRCPFRLLQRPTSRSCLPWAVRPALGLVAVR